MIFSLPPFASSPNHAHMIQAIEALYQSTNRPRDQRIASRLCDLYADAMNEGEEIISSSIDSFKEFFLQSTTLSLPKITLTPDRTLRVRWIFDTKNYIALEFLGYN